MSDIRQQDGAAVSARQQISSTDLTQLIKFLITAFPADDKRPDTAFSWDVLTFKENRLSINTYGILRRLLTNEAMLKAFKKSDHTGFLRDVISPPKGFDAKMGGALFDKTGLSLSTIKLKHLVADELEKLGISADTLLVANPELALKNLATQTKSQTFFQASEVKMVAMGFSKANHKKPFARLFSATEEIQAGDWLTRFSDSTIDLLSEDEDFNDRQRDRYIETFKQQAEQFDSPLSKFFNFLEDQALARVRLKVSFAIMQSLAKQASSTDANAQYFVRYVQKVIALFDYFVTPETEHALHLNLESVYGGNASFSMTEQLEKALFYTCLPVWAESNTQLFEVHNATTVKRDVSYRFRVNGNNSETGLPAFEHKLKGLREKLLDTPTKELSKDSLQKQLSVLVFFWLVFSPAINSDNLRDKALQLTERLKTRDNVRRLLDDLERWRSQVDGLKSQLIQLLRDKPNNIVNHAQKSVDELFVVVQQSIISRTTLERTKGKEPLIKAGSEYHGDDSIEWFKHIKIARKPDDVVNGLFSIQIRTELNDRTLTMQEAAESRLHTMRQPPEKLLNINWRPMWVDEKQVPVKREMQGDINAVWRMGAGVDIWYDASSELLTASHNSSEDQRQYRAATATAMAVIVYVMLQVLSEKLKQQLDVPLSVLMLRFQTQGKTGAKHESDQGNHLIYAISHALEAALMRDVPVRMQGLVTEKTATKGYRDKAAAYALSAAFPLVIGAPNRPAVHKIGVIIYNTRPCDDHPNTETSYTYQAKTYLAEAVDTPFTGYRLAFERMQTHVVTSREAFDKPTLIVEEIKHLHDLGYEHIMLISNDFGNRHINRSAQRHSPHTGTAFLEMVAEKFPDIRLYTLRRDVFPATRLYQRNGESAFEALPMGIHDDFNNVANKQLKPIYSFATLVVVGKDEASRPQSGFCTYFLDTDNQVKNTQWSEQARADLLIAGLKRDCLLQVLRGLHFLEAEKLPDGGVFKPVLDPFAWIKSTSIGKSGEFVALPKSRRSGNVLLSLPALLSHVTDALHARGHHANAK